MGASITALSSLAGNLLNFIPKAKKEVNDVRL